MNWPSLIVLRWMFSWSSAESPESRLSWRYLFHCKETRECWQLILNSVTKKFFIPKYYMNIGLSSWRYFLNGQNKVSHFIIWSIVCFVMSQNTLFTVILFLQFLREQYYMPLWGCKHKHEFICLYFAFNFWC